MGGFVRRIGLAMSVAAVVIGTFVGAASASASPLPVRFSGLDAVNYLVTHPDAPPPGANDWSCRPSPAHPRPVVLVHGTQANMTIDWFTLAPMLKNAGFCVFAFNFGVQATIRIGGVIDVVGGTAPIEDSARELAAFVDRVRTATGAPEVDIVGHSQGGSMPRYYLSYLGGNRVVNTFVGVEPTNHGTDAGGLLSDWLLGPIAQRLGDDPAVTPLLDALTLRSSVQQVQGSAYVHEINDRAPHGGVDPNVRYVVIASATDTTVTPTSSMFLTGPNVTNILLQSGCPLALDDHQGVLYGRYAMGVVLHELDPAVPTPSCSLSLPYIGG
ncbi:alpha/beta fold hydrolase [Gordonia jinhuaensis]|uniref:Lipase n=1 Tax=Gordonia jinhuaensis TaxID=1517702 RepID=A0A916THF9_9ACTN|nr:lipase [Gordonia jinhuaensis]